MKKILPGLLAFIYFFILISPIYASNIALSEKQIKILLVPGHDDQVWGAQYGNTKEATMTLALGTRIYNLLKKDKRFEVHITRDSNGYTKEFADYFINHQPEITAFKENAKKMMQDKITAGLFALKENTPHHTVTADIADRLYGFNKWANENKMDAVIHIHFNDYPRSNKWTIGQYRGFTIYFPDGQLANFKESSSLAADIFTQLHKKYTASTYPPEAGGLIPDQKLIAIGANGTLDTTVRSVLIEYSYIYEKKLRTSAARAQSYKDMAQLTVNGIEKYFFRK